MTKKTFNLSSISNARGLILCTATLMILVFHSSYQIDQSALAFLVSSGYMGVDLFLFVSGIGLYYSLSNNPDVKAFYIRRAVRIIPALFIVSFVWNIFHYPGNIKAFLENLFLVSFYMRGDRTFWYFALIIPLYAVYPLIHKLIVKFHSWAAIVMIAAVVFLSAVFTRRFWQFSLVEIAFARIPVFICGVWFAPYIKTGRPISRAWLLVCAAALIGLNLVLYFHLVEQITIQRFICCPIAISWVFLLAALNEHMTRGKFYSVLIWIGSLSMELYLIQEKVLSVVTPLFPVMDRHLVLLNLCVYPITFALAYLLHLICSWLTKRKTSVL